MASKFSGLTDESDPLLGTRQTIPGCPVTSDFTMPKEAACRGASPACRSSSPCAAAPIFSASLRAIRYFAGVGNAEA